MFHNIKILSLLELSEKVGISRNSTVLKKIGAVAKQILYMGISFGIFTLIFYLMFKVIFLKPGPFLFIFGIFLMQLFSIVSCILTMSQDLYLSKDNALLLTYPVRHEEIFVSKLLVAYLLELKRSFILTLPLFLAYMVINSGLANANYIISAIFYAFILPLVPVLLGSLISIPFVYLTKLFKQSGIVKGIFTLALFAGLIVICGFYSKFLNDIGEIRIVALWNRFLNGFETFLTNVNKFALYCNFVGNAMLGTEPLDIFLNHLWMFLVLVGLVALVIFLVRPTFYKLASGASENAVQRPHKGVNVAHKSTFLTFLRKELILSFRNLSNFASDYVFLFIMPFIIIMLSLTFVHINRNDLGFSLTYGIIGLVTLIMLSASNTASATAISSEGNEFVLLKTAPGDVKNIIWCKLLVNFIISFVCTLITFVLLTIFLRNDIASGQINGALIWLTFVFVILVEIGLLLWSIATDILNPRLREYANSQNRNEIKNSATSILIGLIVSLIFSVIMFGILFLVTPDLTASFGQSGGLAITGVILIGLALVFVGFRFYFLIQYRNAYFEDIQL